MTSPFSCASHMLTRLVEIALAVSRTPFLMPYLRIHNVNVNVYAAIFYVLAELRKGGGQTAGKERWIHHHVSLLGIMLACFLSKCRPLEATRGHATAHERRERELQEGVAQFIRKRDGP